MTPERRKELEEEAKSARASTEDYYVGSHNETIADLIDELLKELDDVRTHITSVLPCIHQLTDESDCIGVDRPDLCARHYLLARMNSK